MVVLPQNDVGASAQHETLQIDSMNNDALNTLATALDATVDTLFANDDGGFRNKAQRLGFVYERIREMNRRWRLSQPCMFPGCLDHSIPRSHTIPRSGALKVIEENGHVVTPRFMDNGLQASIVGIGEASVFPGFCQDHEQLFHSFERNKRIVTGGDMVLQNLRTVCRELRVREEHRRFMSKLLPEHQQMLNTRGLEILTDILGEDFLSVHPVSKVQIEKLDSLSGTLKKEIGQLDASIDEYRRDFLQPLLDELEGRGDHFSICALELSAHLPVCLAGRGNFMLQDGEDIVAILNVWPRAAATDVFMLVQKRHEAAARNYFVNWQQPDFRFVSMVESWMIHGTDHWFLRPSVWNEIPKQRQAAILKDILETPFNIGQEYQGSIFDNLRLEMIKMNEADQRHEVQQYLEHERNKLSEVNDIAAEPNPVQLFLPTPS